METNKRSLLFIVPALLWTLILLLLTLLPGKDIPNTPFLMDIPQFDKFVHAVLFFFFVLSWGYFRLKWGTQTYSRDISRLAWTGLGLGILIEFIQLWWKAIHRDFEILDMVADGFGAVLGAWIGRVYFPALVLKVETWWKNRRFPDSGSISGN